MVGNNTANIACNTTSGTYFVSTVIDTFTTYIVSPLNNIYDSDPCVYTVSNSVPYVGIDFPVLPIITPQVINKRVKQVGSKRRAVICRPITRRIQYRC